MKAPPHPSPAVTNFLATFEGFPLGAALIDANSGRVDEVNGAFAAILKTNRHTLPGTGLAELIETAEASARKLPWVSPEHRQATQFATRLRQADGIPVAVRMTLTPLGLESPHPGHWLCQVETLADAGIPSRRMDTPLVQKMLDSIPAPLAFSTLDSEHRVTYLNRAFQQTFGYTLADIPTVDDWARVAYPDPGYRADSMSAWGEKVARAVASQRPVEPAEYRVTRKDGQERDVLIDANVLDDLLLCVFIDQTEEKARERRLRRSERRFRELTEVMHDAAWVFDPLSWRLNYVSPSVRRIYGYTAEQMLGQPFGQTLAPEFRDTAKDLIHQRLEDFLAGRQPENHFYRNEVPHLTQSGERGWSEVITHFVRDPETGQVELWGVTRDITDRKRAEMALSESEERFRSAFDSSHSGMCMVDLRGRLFRVNRRMSELFGYSQAELEQMTVENLTHPEDLETTRSYFRAALAGRLDKAIIEKRYLNREGQAIHALVSPALVRDAQGQPLYFITQLQDITERKEVEQRLQETLGLLRLAARAADIGIWNWDLSSGRLDWDERLCAWYEAPEEVRQSGLFYEFWASRLDPGDRARAEAVYRAALRDNTLYEDIFRVSLPGGRVRHIQTAAVIELNAKGKPWRVVGVNRDITAQREQEAALRANERKYRLITESMRDVVWVLDMRTLRFPYISPSIETMTGYTPAEYVRNPIGAFLTPEASGQLKALLHQRAEAMLAGQTPQGHAYVDEVEHPHKDGRMIATEVIMTFWLNEDTGGVEVRGVSRDISERKRAQEELRLAKQQAEGASQAKSAFLANMSHEIRTPMNAVLGLAQLLEQEPLTAGQLAMLRHIREAGDHLLSIINDILDFSKIEAGQLHMDPQPFSVSAILQHVDHLMRHAAETKGLTLVIDTPPPGLGKLMADPLRLEQVLFNLANNAIKFTKAGEVRLSVAILDQQEPEPDKVGLRFAVKDTGIGIAPEAQAKLFQSFSQADASITRRFGGTGLGLAISKRIVEMMGGQIGVESREGEGSTFWFTIPFGIASPETALPEAAVGQATPGGPCLTGLRVLAVDDNRINLMVLENALKRQGATVQLAADGQEALLILGTQPRDFDVVLMDIQMPVMDGLAATRAIRRNPAWRDLPVIALTAGVLAEECEAAEQAGMNDFLAKPLDLEQMNALLAPYVPTCHG